MDPITDFDLYISECRHEAVTAIRSDAHAYLDRCDIALGWTASQRQIYEIHEESEHVIRGCAEVASDVALVTDADACRVLAGEMPEEADVFATSAIRRLADALDRTG